MDLKYACNKSIISLLRGRTLGNTTAIQHMVHEAHSAHWMDRKAYTVSVRLQDIRLVRSHFDKVFPRLTQSTTCLKCSGFFFLSM